MGSVFELFLHILMINGSPDSAYVKAIDAANNAVAYLKPDDKLEIKAVRLYGDEFKSVDYIYMLLYVNPSNDYSNDIGYFEDRDKMINFISGMGLDEFKSFHVPVWYPIKDVV